MERMDVVTKGMGTLLKTSNKQALHVFVATPNFMVGKLDCKHCKHPNSIDGQIWKSLASSQCVPVHLQLDVRNFCAARAQIYSVGGAIVLFVILATWLHERFQLWVWSVDVFLQVFLILNTWAQRSCRESESCHQNTCFASESPLERNTMKRGSQYFGLWNIVNTYALDHKYAIMSTRFYACIGICSFSGSKMLTCRRNNIQRLSLKQGSLSTKCRLFPNTESLGKVRTWHSMH